MVTELQSGPCIVIEVSHKNEDLNIVADFRNFCGPVDPVCYYFACYCFLVLITLFNIINI